jgi:hypothetical protein
MYCFSLLCFYLILEYFSKYVTLSATKASKVKFIVRSERAYLCTLVFNQNTKLKPGQIRLDVHVRHGRQHVFETRSFVQQHFSYDFFYSVSTVSFLLHVFKWQTKVRTPA